MSKNNTDDIECLIKTYGKDVLRVCNYYLQNKQDAEDAFQEVFIKLMRKHSTFCGKSEFKTWMTRIVINTCKNILKSNNLKRNIACDANLFDYNEKQHIDTSDEFYELYQIIVSLPVDYKDVILLKFYSGYSSKEIAKILRITESAVNSRLHRAKIYLKEILNEKG